MANKKEQTFEEMLVRLQEISELLENDESGLENSISLYEEGIKLSKLCYNKLKTAELKVTELKKELDDQLNTDE